MANDPNIEMFNFMKAEIPGFLAVQVSSLVVHLILGVVLLISGIGLLNMGGWARIAAIAYSIVTIVVQLAELVYQLFYVNPVVNRWLQRELQRANFGKAPPEAAGFLATFITIGSVIGAFIMIGYAVVLLIMMLLPKVSAAFAGPSRRTLEREDEEYYDEGFERRRRDDEDAL
jgi:ABC-type transport system involved in cytochrome bd biosynthesis fused ATPase/permease subunit